jgi:hypothetical protein
MLAAMTRHTDSRLSTPDFLRRFDKVKKTGNGWMVRCPVHSDNNPSLHITEGDDRILIHCFAGCDGKEVIAKVGLTWADLGSLRSSAHRGPKASDTPRRRHVPSRETESFSPADLLATSDNDLLGYEEGRAIQEEGAGSRPVDPGDENASPDVQGDGGIPKTESGQQRAQTRRLSEVKARPLSWFWKNRSPRGAATMHDGDPDLAKSLGWIDIAARASHAAGKFPDGEPCKGPLQTLLLSAEDAAETVLRPRYDAAGGDPDRVVLLESVRRKRKDAKPTDELEAPDLFSLTQDLEILEEVLRRERFDLLIVDPVSAYLGDVNSFKDSEVRRVLAPLAALAVKFDLAVVLIRHLNKMANVQNVLYRGGGSIGFVGAARSGLFSAKDPDDPERRLLATYKHNLCRGAETLAYRPVPSKGNSEIPIIEWLGTDPRSAQEINAAAGESFEQKSARGDARGFLKELLAEGPVDAEVVYAEAGKSGIAKRTLARASAELKVAKVKTGFEKGWVWKLP